MSIPLLLSTQQARYLLMIIFLFAGGSKCIDATAKHNANQFPTLPKWFWPICGAWELSITILLFCGLRMWPLCMAYIVLGGIIYASTVLRNKKYKTALQETFGLILLPPLFTLYLAYTVTVATAKMTPLFGVVGVFVGMGIGHQIVSNKKTGGIL